MNDIRKIIQKALVRLEEVDDIIDSSLEDIKDITDTAGDIAGPIKLVVSLYGQFKRRKFKSFLKSYGKNIQQSISTTNHTDLTIRL